MQGSGVPAPRFPQPGAINCEPKPPSWKRQAEGENLSKALSQGPDPEGTSAAAAQRPCLADQETWRWKGLPFSHRPVGAPASLPGVSWHSPRPSSTPCQLLAEALTSQPRLPRPCFLRPDCSVPIPHPGSPPPVSPCPATGQCPSPGCAERTCQRNASGRRSEGGATQMSEGPLGVAQDTEFSKQAL